MLNSLFAPIEINGLRLKNRIISTAHAPAYGDNGMPCERYQRYHEEKARGGLAMTMFGGSSPISTDSPASFGQLDLSRDAVVPHFQKFSDRIHALDCALICQITHLGRRTHWQAGDWLPPVAPSPLREAAHGTFPKAIDKCDIDRILEDFSVAARRCKAGGLDGCEVMTGGQLIGQFLSPITNQRTDSYGGNLENRMRFGLEVLKTVRDEVGSDFVLGLRFSADDRDEGGIDLPEGIEIARTFAETGYLDYLNVVIGNNWTHDGVASTVPNMSFPCAPHLMAASKIKKAVSIPVIHAARIADLETADFAIREGLIDLVGMTRAHLADPYLVEKLQTGWADRIRPCVGANYCIDRIYKGAAALCVHNVATGRETVLAHKTLPADTQARRVIVIGGGPGGMEAARVSAERGHEVTLFEATGMLGGQILTAARAPRRKSLIGIVDWLSAELSHLRVDIRFDTYAKSSDVLALKPEVVIVATGGLPNLDSIAGGDLATSTWDILNGFQKPGLDVLMFDDHGEHQAASVAEYLLENGAETVTFAHPERGAFPALGPTNAAIHYKHLYSGKVRFLPNTRLTGIEREGNVLNAALRNEYSHETEMMPFTQIVVEHGTLPADDVFADLQAASVNGGVIDLGAFAAGQAQSLGGGDGFTLWRVGYAVVTRDIHAALLDARRLCQNL